MSQLQDKIAWVTGAGTGIGEAAALALAKEGASVVLTGRRLEPLEAVAARIIQAGGTAHVQAGDMTVPGSVAAIADYIKTTLGRLDILVANAGVNIRERDWAQLTPEGADSVITGNLTSVFYCVSAVLPMMRAQKGGVVIITASIAGRFISGLSGAAYTAAKHGVVAMSHT
ncbi:MAG TPA: SDR family NAD(P)-dependent oxidoreductase, partial [Acetobacteraceae bacterium]